MLLKKTRINSKQTNHSHKMELKRATSWNNYWNQFISKNFASARPPQMTSIVQKNFGEECRNPSPAHCNLQFLNTGLCGLYQMIKKKWAWFSSLSNRFELKQHIAPRQMIQFVVGRRQTIPNAPGNAPLKIWPRPSSKRIKPMSKIVTVKDCNSATSN